MRKEMTLSLMILTKKIQLTSIKTGLVSIKMESFLNGECLRKEQQELFQERRKIVRSYPIDHRRMGEIIKRAYEIEEVLVFGKVNHVYSKSH